MNRSISPEVLINNSFWRNIVDRTPFFTARRIIRNGALPLVSPPWKTREMKRLVAKQFQTCFPNMPEYVISRYVRDFVYHWGCKFAEDCILVNVEGPTAIKKLIEEVVLFEGRENFHGALGYGKGCVLAGSHMGTTILCEYAMIHPFLDIPQKERPSIGIIIEPSVAKFPRVLESQRLCLIELNLDVKLFLNTEGRQSVVQKSLATLRNEGVVTSRLDVVMGGKSKRIYNLFGRLPIYLPAIEGTAKLALRAGSSILVYSSYRTAGGIVVKIEPPIGPVTCLGDDLKEDSPELDALCDVLFRRLERQIAAHPEQWAYWDRVHRRVARQTK